MHSTLRTIGLLLLLFFSLEAGLFAQAIGQVVLYVKDTAGQPIKDVAVTITNDQTGFHQEKTTNKKGKVTISVVDATRVYKVHMEHSDHTPLDITVQPQVRTSITREVVMGEGEGEGGVQMVFSAAEKAFNLGVEAVNGGDYATAEAQFLVALEKDHDLAEAHSALSSLYALQGKYEEALAAAQKFREMEPENPRGFRLLYEAYHGLGRKEEADAALESLSNLDTGGDTVAILYNEGVEALRIGDPKSAKARFQEALQLDPNLIVALDGLALVYMNEQNYVDAAAAAEKILASEPENARALRIRYDAYKALGQDEKAKEAFEALAAVDPQSLADEFYNTGAKLFEGGDTEGAITNFERVVEIDPERAKAHYYLGLCYINTGESAKAKSHLETFVELTPDDPDAATAREMIAYMN